MITLLGGIVGAQLWQRRKLTRIARRVNYDGRLVQAAIRITNEVRGSVDIARMLETTALEVKLTLDVDHCCISINGEDGKQTVSACSCGESDHEYDSAVAFTSAVDALGGGGADRYVHHGYANRTGSESRLTGFPVLGVPITQDGRLAGTLLLLSGDPIQVWLESEVQLLLAVAHQLSLSVSHARAFAAKERESLTDSLTRCLNRRGFDMQLESHFQAAKERNLPISLIMIDLDLFKAINDNYGHAIGDGVLRTLAGILLEETSDGVIAARVGGEEFALILPGHSVEQAVVIAERVRQRVEHMTTPDLVCSITVSCGVASFPLHALSEDGVFATADKALYRAKTSGRNQVCAF